MEGPALTRRRFAGTLGAALGASLLAPGLSRAEEKAAAPLPVRLDSNENPYGPHPAVRAALSEHPFLHIYPDPEQRELRAALSEYVGVPAENILPGHGADELIDLLVRIMAGPGDAIIDCPPTFGMYSFDAALAGEVVPTGATVRRGETSPGRRGRSATTISTKRRCPARLLEALRRAGLVAEIEKPAAFAFDPAGALDPAAGV